MNQGHKTKSLFLNRVANWIACKQALRGTLVGGGGGGKEYLQLCLWNLNSCTSNSFVAAYQLRCLISANQHKAETRENINKHWKTRAKGNDVITNVISTNQHFAVTFLCRYSNSRDLVANFPSFSYLSVRLPQRAYLQARDWTIFVLKYTSTQPSLCIESPFPPPED